MKCDQGYSQPVRDKRRAAILVAAGSGSRMDPSGIAAVPKVLYQLGSCSVLEWSLRAICATGLFSSAYIVISEIHHPEFKRVIDSFLGGSAAQISEIKLVVGGDTRRESVRNGLQAAAENGFAGDDIILVHDAARPFISAEIIERCVREAEASGSVTVAIPATDSLLQTSTTGQATALQVEGFLNRDAVWQIQTPQVFHFQILNEAHQQLTENDGATPPTDDSSLAFRIAPLAVVEGSRINFKLTVPEDLLLARAIVETGLSKLGS